MLVPSTPLLGYQILNSGTWIYRLDNHLLMLCGQLAMPLLPWSLQYLPLLWCLSRISTAKRSWRYCAGAQAIRTWDDQYWWFFQLTSPKDVSWTFMSSSVKMIFLSAVPQAQVLHSFTEAHLLGKLILWSVMSHAKIATQLKSLNLLTQIDWFPFWANK